MKTHVITKTENEHIKRIKYDSGEGCLLIYKEFFPMIYTSKQPHIVYFEFDMLQRLANAFPESLKQEVLREMEARVGEPVNPDFITENGTEICVACRGDTGVFALTPIGQRKHYVEGVGQHCSRCQS